MWSITTNPFRLRPWPNFLRNVANLRALARRCGAHIATRASDVRAARARGEHAIIMSVQGANALSSPEQVAQIPNDIVLRMTLVHLTPSWIGAPSSPGHWLRRRKGLTPEGRALVHAMNARRVLVDLAHLHRGGFRDAVEAHDRSLPFVVTHGGVDAVHPHWRNVNDEEIRAVANSGGVVGVITAGLYLGPPGRGRSGAERWVDHLEHLIRVGGEDVAAVGTDFDGFIIPARGIRGAHAYPLLVDAMLRRGLSDRVVRKVLGENALRVLEELRG